MTTESDNTRTGPTRLA